MEGAWKVIGVVVVAPGRADIDRLRHFPPEALWFGHVSEQCRFCCCIRFMWVPVVGPGKILEVRKEIGGNRDNEQICEHAI